MATRRTTSSKPVVAHPGHPARSDGLQNMLDDDSDLYHDSDDGVETGKLPQIPAALAPALVARGGDTAPVLNKKNISVVYSTDVKAKSAEVVAAAIEGLAPAATIAAGHGDKDSAAQRYRTMKAAAMAWELAPAETAASGGQDKKGDDQNGGGPPKDDDDKNGGENDGDKKDDEAPKDGDVVDDKEDEDADDPMNGGNGGNDLVALSDPVILPTAEHLKTLLPDDDAESLAALAKRVYALATFSKESDAIYGATKLPVGRVNWSGKDSKKLVMSDTKEPVTIWLVGAVTNVYLCYPDGNPCGRISITVHPVVPASGTSLQEFVGLLGSPRVIPDYTDIRAAKWMASNPRTGIIPFDETYDARKKFNVNKVMSEYPASGIQVTDIVLVEAQVVRYPAKKENTTPSPRKAPYASRDMSNWVASYDLVSVSVLAVGPGPENEPKKVPDWEFSV